MSKGPFGGATGKHAMGRQQSSGKHAKDGAGKGQGLFSRNTGKHALTGKEARDAARAARDEADDLRN